MIVVSAGIVYLIAVDLPPNITPSAKVRVAVLDSGIDIDYGLQNRVVAQQSFITVENGYNTTDLTVSDSKPEDVAHGTIIAKQIATSSNIQIVNGKVLGESGSATTVALVEAIYWAVEQNSSIINLSLGGTPTLGDPLQQAVEWAFSQGVVVVTSAGNSGDSGNLGTTIESPAL